MTNFAFELDPLELEEVEAELGEHGNSAKTSVSSVTTPPPHGKRIPFFKKVINSVWCPVRGVRTQLLAKKRGWSGPDVVHSIHQACGLSA